MATPKVIIVTGANRGIGRAICQGILTTEPSISPLKLFAASRSGADLGLQSTHSTRSVMYPKLDISDRTSVRALADEVQQYGSVDVLINNAGINLDGKYGVENTRKTLEVNYWATLDMCQTFVPLLSKNGRIVNLSSVACSLKAYSTEIQARFRNASNISDLDSLANDFLTSVENGSEEASGFGPPGRSYSISKGLVNGFTGILAKQNPGLVINCCCPGWVATDMGQLVGSRPPKRPEDGATIPLRLAFGDINGETGKYWGNDSIRGKGDGHVQPW